VLLFNYGFPAIIVNGAMFASDDIAPAGVPNVPISETRSYKCFITFIAGMPSTATFQVIKED
jgi:hypothetical protein